MALEEMHTAQGSMNGSKRTLISRSQTAQSQQFPDHVFSFLGTVTHLLYGYVVRWEAVSEGHQSHHLGASVVGFFLSGNYEFSASEHGSSSLPGSVSLCVHQIV